MKSLLLCRHAKSSWSDITLADIDRPLNKRGRRDAPLMGARLAMLGVKPDAVVSSPARRAYKTARYLAGALGFSRKMIIVINEIYEASPDILLATVRAFDNNVEQVIMVGHNSEITVLANKLGGLGIDNIPTCGVVALDFAVRSWRDVMKSQGAQAFFEYPRKVHAD
ncbi:MAG TPA: histidine phosphatase family protein [Desulfobacteraceae bacterium]|nr:histidine phosphatase family protein [Desulfobacteraceae bacterium]HDO30371.1 histidine phosphatase family protein [Desulfobacteraceae bacterium]